MSSLFISANKDTLFPLLSQTMILKMFSVLILFQQEMLCRLQRGERPSYIFLIFRQQEITQ